MKGDTIPPLSHDAVPRLSPLSLIHSLSLFLSFIYLFPLRVSLGFSFVLSTQCHYYKQPNSLTLSYEATLDPFTTLYQHTTLYIHIQYANIFYTIGQFHSFMGRQ